MPKRVTDLAHRKKPVETPVLEWQITQNVVITIARVCVIRPSARNETIADPEVQCVCVWFVTRSLRLCPDDRRARSGYLPSSS